MVDTNRTPTLAQNFGILDGKTKIEIWKPYEKSIQNDPKRTLKEQATMALFQKEVRQNHDQHGLKHLKESR